MTHKPSVHLPTPLETLAPLIEATLQESADPEQARTFLAHYLQHASPHLLETLRQTPRLVQMLILLSGGSRFIATLLQRTPDLLEGLRDIRTLTTPKSSAQFHLDSQTALEGTHGHDALLTLRRYQRWELLRIGAADFFGLLDTATITEQLSLLAETCVRMALQLAANDTNTDPKGLCILAFGKLGGYELNYSSDIDLVFLAEENGFAYERLARRTVDILTRNSEEGFLYRVDLRLRPWGRVGVLVPSQAAYERYLRENARAWERQALLKARPIAGDLQLGYTFLHTAQPHIFTDESHEDVRLNVHAMKARIEAFLKATGRSWGEVKLGAGSIRDIEFVAQYLQLAHGARLPAILTPNTLDALQRLLAHHLLSDEDERILREGYLFLRTVEHALQLRDFRQTHTLPDDPNTLRQLARRLGFEGDHAADDFLAQYEAHTSAVRRVYERHLLPNAQQTISAPTNDTVADHVARLAPSYREIFTPQEIQMHAAFAASLDEQTPVHVHAEPDGENWRLTIVGYDARGALSIICGLLFAYGANILDGQIFTYEPDTQTHHRRKLVDVFTIAGNETLSFATWSAYEDELRALFRHLLRDDRDTARHAIIERLSSRLAAEHPIPDTLYPVEIEIDNDADPHYTVLHIQSRDTVGFLFELSNALTINGIDIARVVVRSEGEQVHDTLWVTDREGRKITDEHRLRQLRAAIVLVKHFTHLLPHSPNPVQALRSFRDFLANLFANPNWPDEFATLERPKVLDALARLLGVSEFLWEDFLRMQHDNLFPVVQHVETLDWGKSAPQMTLELETLLAEAQTLEERKRVLNAYKDREMFRIDMRYILGRTPAFEHFAAELSDLAEVVVNAAHHIAEAHLHTQYGTPRTAANTPARLAIFALGKFGGRELGFASDIELLFVYEGNGTTTGPTVITTAEYYERLVALFLQLLESRRKGIFEIDLRLRPYGRAGSLAVPIAAFERYFAPDGPAWPYERQALVRLRPVGGDVALGARIMALRDTFVYTGRLFDVAAMRAMRERQIRQLVRPGTFNAKFSPGGLVDVEYTVQALQITYGHRSPALRVPNIRQALHALYDAHLLDREEYATLRSAHIFLRQLIEALRIVRGNAEDLTVPQADTEAFRYLARRLGYGQHAHQLDDDIRRVAQEVRDTSTRVLQKIEEDGKREPG
ncbi:hypothetical protein ARMA_1390 [Ardenticatena maritima]|uniref:ACT domain-containing protein n=1 Tax=Ardenticatena maritima TaxID=872965 RepID=A0A0M9UCK8_9CHLR|nr:hypothetical protein [Ardenticatena maritima]GAP62967.1 hypothetical protein ARMA_1390 [Ardenticatena maritima]